VLCQQSYTQEAAASEEKLLIWKAIHNKDQLDERKGTLGPGYWAGFMKRHGHLLVTKRGEKYAIDRTEWSKQVYIKQMYDVIYDEMADAGVATRLADVVHILVSTYKPDLAWCL
jgi:hypothetical protein